MAKTLVIYFSAYGSAKKYAEWIAGELSGDVFSIKEFREDTITNYDTIVLGSALYVGKIQGINILVNNFEKIKDKKLVLFTCGLSDPEKPENIYKINNILEKVVPDYIRQKAKIFYLRGGINYKKLSISHRIMMWVVKTALMKKKSEELTDDEKGILETYGKEIDFTKINNLTDLVKYCR